MAMKTWIKRISGLRFLAQDFSARSVRPCKLLTYWPSVKFIWWAVSCNNAIEKKAIRFMLITSIYACLITKSVLSFAAFPKKNKTAKSRQIKNNVVIERTQLKYWWFYRGWHYENCPTPPWRSCLPAMSSDAKHATVDLNLSGVRQSKCRQTDSTERNCGRPIRRPTSSHNGQWCLYIA